MERPVRGRDNLVEQLVHACRSDPVIASGRGRMVVGFSGGPDSTALLHGLWRGARGLRLDLHVVHVDHGLRPSAAADSTSAIAFAAELGLSCRTVRVRPRGGGEDAARRARHRALETVAAELGAPTVALGHTADDQVETVLLHLIRGSGLEGIAAMTPREGLRFRPLLAVGRPQVEAYCARNGLRPTEDGTNRDPRFARNRVRHELLPLLEDRFNPRIRDAVLRLAEAARQEHDAVAAAAQDWLGDRRGPLPRADFNRLPQAVRVQALRRWWARTSGREQLPGGAALLSQALRLVAGGDGGMIHLGSGFELLVHGPEFEIRPRNGPLPPR
ncbi:MAG TPA: tRNA lysidine(34) synthetase TilS [Candidatus Dormibacteraeota bacterium]